VRRRVPLADRLMNDTLVVGLAILAVAGVILAVTSRAQNGLPWQDTYDVRVTVPDAGKLTKNADVRIGGARVGQVLSIDALPPEGDEPPRASLKLQLKEVEPLPVDTTVEVRLASVLGGKYVSLVPGDAERTVPEGGTLPLRNARASVDLDEAFRMFDPAGRRGVRQVIDTLGTALAGRGEELNEAIEVTARVLPPARRVLRTLGAAETDLPGFVRGAAAAAGALRPVSAAVPPLLDRASRTFAALQAAGPRLGEAIDELPPAARRASSALRTIRPVLDDAAQIARDLRPAATTLRPAARALSRTMRKAVEVNPEVAGVAEPLGSVLDSVGAFTGRPSATNALRLLGSNDLATFGASAFVGLGGILDTAWEAERHCRVATNWVEALNDVLSEGDAGGNWIRMIPVFQLDEMLPAAEPAPELHVNPYPNENASECEAGNEPYLPGQRIGNVPGLQAVPGGGR